MQAYGGYLRGICLLAGYLLGGFLTAEAVARCLTGKSARALGTGNPGMANITAQLGKAAGFAVPQSFTVRDKKWVRVTVRIVGVLIAVFFTAMFIGVIGSSIVEPEGWSLAETVGFSAFALVFAVFGVFLIFLVRRRLVVEGGVFSYLPTFGRSRAFRL